MIHLSRLSKPGDMSATGSSFNTLAWGSRCAADTVLDARATVEESCHRVYLRREDMCPKKVIDKLVLDSDAYRKGTKPR